MQASSIDHFTTGRPVLRRTRRREQQRQLSCQCQRFVTSFWYHKPDDPEDDQAWHGMMTLLETYAQQPPERPWSEAVADFRTAEARVRTIRDARTRVYRDVQQRDRLVSTLEERRRAVSIAAAHVIAAKEKLVAAEGVMADEAAEAERIARDRQRQETENARARKADTERTLAQHTAKVDRIRTGRKSNAERAVHVCEVKRAKRWQLRDEHQQGWPSFWTRLRTFGAASQRWRRRDKLLADEIETAERELVTAQRELNVAQDELDQAQEAVDAARHALATVQRLLDDGVPMPTVTHKPLERAHARVRMAKQTITGTARRDHRRAPSAVNDRRDRRDRPTARRCRHQLGCPVPDPTWRDDRRRRELAALWTDEEWNQARSALFLVALALHKEFLRHTATEMRRNLRAAIDVLEGDAPRDAAEEAALAAWQSLFLVVPVVSTTFASFSRLFGHLGREALGWLLVDEAGQASPQQVIGALWRCRRAVVVGDPLQLEPVITLPIRAEQAIRNNLGVDAQWSTTRSSAQRLADRQTVLGTWLPDADEKTWVGVPLTVHRRCDQPMFDIINTVVYDGLMIDGTGTAAGEAFKAAYPTLPDSKWIDVTSSNANGHWIPDEGEHLDRVLRALATLMFDMTEVLAIGPFKAVADQLRTQARRHPGLVAGTIHTAQGKQSDIVILVLGSDPKKHGSRQWASSKPNLLNVAVSRAKRRLYVIGDLKAWSSWPYFSTLARALHTRPLPL